MSSSSPSSPGSASPSPTPPSPSSPSASSGTPSYAAVLRTPHAGRTFGAALWGRLSYGMLPLSLVLAVREATGSYATAGTVMALFGLTSVVLAPIRAGALDRYGVRRVLPLLATGYATLLAGLALASLRDGVPGPLLGALAMAAGALTPPLGPVMRTLWSRLIPDRGLLRRAYSLDAVAEELLLVVGPLLVGLLLTVTVPAAGLGVCAVLVLTGSLAFATAPPVRADRGSAASAASDAVPAERHGPAPRTSPGLRQAVAVAAGTGMCLGALDLLVIAFTDAHHQPGTAAWALAALSAGSAVGGLTYGAVPWRSPSRLRLALLAVALGLVLAATGLAPHPAVLVAWVGVGGLFVAPALTTAYLLADESVRPSARTRAGTWVNSAFNAGSTGATAATGWLVGRLPLALCFALAAVPAVLSAATAVRWPRRGDHGGTPVGADRRSPGRPHPAARREGTRRPEA